MEETGTREGRGLDLFYCVNFDNCFNQSKSGKVEGQLSAPVGDSVTFNFAVVALSHVLVVDFHMKRKEQTMAQTAVLAV